MSRYQAVIVTPHRRHPVRMPWVEFDTIDEARAWCHDMNAKHVPADGKTRFDYEEIQ